MPETEVVFFAESDRFVPLLEWLANLPRKVQTKCLERIEGLARFGHELRRPLADYLRDDVYELRVKHMRVNYRMLYFFHEQTAVLSHGFTKKREIPEREINLALARHGEFRESPQTHTFRFRKEVDDD